MKAKVADSRAMLLLAEAQIPAAIALAFRAGQLHTGCSTQPPIDHRSGLQSGSRVRKRNASPRKPLDGRLQPVDPMSKLKGEQE